MRYNKMLAVLLSVVCMTPANCNFLSFNNSLYNNTINMGTSSYHYFYIDEDSNEPDRPEDLNIGGYLKSEFDYNTPVYSPDFITYSNVPASFPDDINDIYSSYPSYRNQNPYGTCWAFASIGLAEFDLVNDSLYGNGNFDKNIDLSELQLAYFTFNSVLDPLGGTEGDYAKYYNENASVSYLNYGGNYEMASRRLGQWCGPVNESLVPYSNAYSTLSDGIDSSFAFDNNEAHLQNTYMINIKSNAQDVKTQIMEHGAVGVMYYHADSSFGWNSDLSQYTYNDSSLSGGGHAVMIVGWDDNFSKDNFTGSTKPSNDGAWLVRNSWGMYGNYFWMSYDTASLADTAWVFDFSADDGYDNNYQLDGGIMVYPDTNYKTLANVFNTKNTEGVSSELLQAVSLSFKTKANVNYTVEIYTDLSDEQNPLSGTKQEDATTSGTTAYAGTYTIPLESSVRLEPGTYFSVVVKLDSAVLDYEQAQSIVSSFDENQKMIWDCAVSRGNNKSFYYTGNRFYPFYWGNYCVKAFTSDETSNTSCQNHSWDAGVTQVAATCTKGGSKLYTCGVCKTTKTETIPELGHNYSTDWTIDKVATCTEDGSKSHHCIRCDSVKDETVILKTGHKWDAGVTQVAATCTKEGSKLYTCSVCKTTKTETIPELGHNYSIDWTIDKAVTCTEDGSKSHHCTRCDSVKDETVITKTGHKWDAGVTQVAATCTKEGSKLYTCSVCKTTKTETIPELGHNYSTDWTIDKAATCTEDGSKSHHCTRCDSVKDETVITKTGHKWDAGELIKQPTYDNEGLIIYRCMNCTATKEESVEKLEIPAETPTNVGITVNSADRFGLSATLSIRNSNLNFFEYSWYATKDGSSWILIQDWTPEENSIFWTPDVFGTYTVVGKVRAKGHPDTEQSVACNFEYHPQIKGKCQMPYSGEQGIGYLIGVESYENPNQKYQYEMLILDCTLLAQNLPAWTYTTGKFTVPQGNAGWCIWTPKYGYYWTLFRVYDENGILIDEQCYGFANVC